MALAVGVWAIVLGYAIAWCGWRNFGITYCAGTSGVEASATPVTLLGALTGKDVVMTPGACGNPGGKTTSPTTGARTSPIPQPQPSPSPQPSPQPNPNLHPGLNAIGSIRAVPAPQGNISGWLQQLGSEATKEGDTINSGLKAIGRDIDKAATGLIQDLQKASAKIGFTKSAQQLGQIEDNPADWINFIPRL
jgi:predicted component of type VI protein secretion system